MAASDDARVRVTRRSLVKASGGFRASPHVVALSNLDLIPESNPISLLCVYRTPSDGGFRDVVAAFEAKLPFLLDHFLPLTGRFTASRRPAELCWDNQGAELVLGEVRVPLASLDYGDLGASLARTGVPVRYGAGVALSVQLVSFACGGFAVAWGSNHALVDGYSLSMVANAWSQLARSGTILLPATNHDRSVFRPRAPPSYGSSVGEAFTPLRSERLVNALTNEASFVRRTYYVEARDLAALRARASRSGAGERGRATRLEALSAHLWKVLAAVVRGSDESCRMGWWVDGRRRLPSSASASAMRGYVGNVLTFAVAEVSVETIQGRPLPGVASMVRECIRSTATEEHFQQVIDWVEEHKDDDDRYVQASNVGLGSPVLAVASLASISYDTDFGFGHAALAMPTTDWDGGTCRLCCGFVQIMARPPGPGDGGWILIMYVWPRLAAALDSDEGTIFKLLTAEHLRLTHHSRL